MLLSQNLIPCSLTFCSFNPYLLFKILNFLVCLLFIHASIHNNLSAGAQNVTAATGAYVIMLVYRHLLITHLHGKAAVCKPGLFT